MHIEAGGSSGTQASLNDADIRDMIGKASGAQMSFNEWYGASASYLDTTSTAPYGGKPYEYAASASNMSQTMNLSTRQAIIFNSNASYASTCHFYWDADTSLIGQTVTITFDIDFTSSGGMARYDTDIEVYVGLCNNSQSSGLQSVSSSSGATNTITDLGFTDTTTGCIKKILEFRRNPAQDWYDTYDASGSYVRTNISSTFSGAALTGRTFTHTFSGSASQCRPWFGVRANGITQPGAWSGGTNSFDMVIS